MNKPIHILFVEDDAEMLAIYRENFVRPDFEVMTALNGKCALQILEREKFDVVLTDNYMPGISGMSLLKQIKQKNPGVRFLMITGYASSADHLVALNNPSMRFVDKPVKLRDLKLMIQKLAG